MSSWKHMSICLCCGAEAPEGTCYCEACTRAQEETNMYYEWVMDNEFIDIED